MTDKKNDTFEQALLRLRQNAEKIRSQDTDLEDAIKYYEEGMKDYKVCRGILDSARQKIEQFEEEAGSEGRD
ncbi:MAG: exodeoxyribonuclease VII small subunit [Eubacterium sp.]|nr:exodeoxyribonuclease VII small subunit [Eubacterium sp.]